jgi:hypothetical protein
MRPSAKGIGRPPATPAPRIPSRAANEGGPSRASSAPKHQKHCLNSVRETKQRPLKNRRRRAWTSTRGRAEAKASGDLLRRHQRVRARPGQVTHRLEATIITALGRQTAQSRPKLRALLSCRQLGCRCMAPTRRLSDSARRGGEVPRATVPMCSAASRPRHQLARGV